MIQNPSISSKEEFKQLKWLLDSFIPPENTKIVLAEKSRLRPLIITIHFKPCYFSTEHYSLGSKLLQIYLDKQEHKRTSTM